MNKYRSLNRVNCVIRRKTEIVNGKETKYDDFEDVKEIEVERNIENGEC